MSACTFFGHRDAPDSVLPSLTDAIERLIATEDVTHFYVGTHGAFDRMAYHALKQAKMQHPHIHINVVLAYMPTPRDDCYGEDSLLPEGIETVPKRFAINYRNEWMLRHSTHVISYVVRNFCGAARYVDLARKQNKTIISLT